MAPLPAAAACRIGKAAQDALEVADIVARIKRRRLAKPPLRFTRVSAWLSVSTEPSTTCRASDSSARTSSGSVTRYRQLLASSSSGAGPSSENTRAGAVRSGSANTMSIAIDSRARFAQLRQQLRDHAARPRPLARARQRFIVDVDDLDRRRLGIRAARRAGTGRTPARADRREMGGSYPAQHQRDREHQRSQRRLQPLVHRAPATPQKTGMTIPISGTIPAKMNAHSSCV